MTGFSHLPMQTALYQKLTQDSTLMGMVTGVYDRPQQLIEFPYIIIGEATILDWSTKTNIGTDQRVTLHIWSREGGRAQAAAIMERIHSLLHNGSLTITGQTLVAIRFLSGNITLEDDGWTYQGTMQFRALLESN